MESPSPTAQRWPLSSTVSVPEKTVMNSCVPAGGFGIKTGSRIQLNGVHLEPSGIVEREYGVVPVFPVCFDKRRYGGSLDDFDIRFRAQHERRERDLQSIRYLPQRRDSRVGHAAFDLPEHTLAHSRTFRYGIKAEFPFFPKSFEVLRYNQADIFQGRYPVRI